MNGLLCLSDRPPLCQSVTPFSQWFCHHVILNISGVITIDRDDVHAKRYGPRSKVKVANFKTHFAPTWACSRRGNLLFFKVIRQSSHRRKSSTVTRTRASRPSFQCEFTDVFEMMDKAGSGIEDLPYSFPGHPSIFEVTRAEQLTAWLPFHGFSTVAQLGIIEWLWNETYSFCKHQSKRFVFFRGCPSYSKVTRSDNWRFGSDLG